MPRRPLSRAAAALCAALLLPPAPEAWAAAREAALPAAGVPAAPSVLPRLPDLPAGPAAAGLPGAGAATGPLPGPALSSPVLAGPAPARAAGPAARAALRELTPQERAQRPAEESAARSGLVFDGLAALPRPADAPALPALLTAPAPLAAAAPQAAAAARLGPAAARPRARAPRPAPWAVRLARRARAFLVRAAMTALPIGAAGLSMTGSSCTDEKPVASRTWRHPDGTVSVFVQAEPFALTVKDASGRILLESAPAKEGEDGDQNDPLRAYAPLAITHSEDFSPTSPVQGWDSALSADRAWGQSARVTGFEAAGAGLVARVLTGQGEVDLRIEPQGPGVRLRAEVVGPSAGINRVSLSFKLHDDAPAGGPAGDHFFGFGERFVRSDHRGQKLYNWVEDGGIGAGEGVAPGLVNPFPNGEGQTNIPIPWFVSPRGFGLLLNGTHRTVHHLGDEAPDAWRVESWRPALDATLFVSPDPLVLVERLTAVTGRPPEVADWVLAPRRRANAGTDELDKLRAAKIPTSSLDYATHYFPGGGGDDTAAMRALTADSHKKGYKAISYFNSFVSTDWHPVYEDAAAKGYFVKRPDGSPYVVFNYPNHQSMVDFTNPAAKAWYQSWLEKALDDGWDGWMYDFAEYVPRDAVFFDGMRGEEAHNLYPVLFQQAAHEVMERRKRGDYLVFVRSGFIGTGGLVPMVWAGDQNTDFSDSDGLPAALTGALNAGVSGLPLWDSDIGGYHFLSTTPTDKELYLRWTELGAFSAGMHDENNGQGIPGYSGPADRWGLWSDSETQDTYRFYASWHTRMVPYAKLAVRQARERGTPVMRHLYLSYPQDRKVWGLTDEYMYGDSLLVAPVVKRGARSRAVYLPEPAYYDFWTGARVAGGRTADFAAPLGAVPVFAKPGAIVPLLHPDVQTLVPSTDGSVVSAADRADFLEAAVFSGGESSVTLGDGTSLSQSAPLAAYEPGVPMRGGQALPWAADEAELMTCAACAWKDPGGRLLKVAVVGTRETITAGALTLAVSGAPSPKRFLFSVRH